MKNKIKQFLQDTDYKVNIFSIGVILMIVSNFITIVWGEYSNKLALVGIGLILLASYLQYRDEL